MIFWVDVLNISHGYPDLSKWISIQPASLILYSWDIRTVDVDYAHGDLHNGQKHDPLQWTPQQIQKKTCHQTNILDGCFIRCSFFWESCFSFSQLEPRSKLTAFVGPTNGQFARGGLRWRCWQPMLTRHVGIDRPYVYLLGLHHIQKKIDRMRINIMI